MSEADTCRKYIVPKLYAAGWDDEHIREQVHITDGRISPTGRNSFSRAAPKIPDYVLDIGRFQPIAVVEAKADYLRPDTGLQQAMQYAQMMDVKFAYSSNGHGIVEHDFLTGRERDLAGFPSPADLWARLRGEKGLDDEQDAADALTAYYEEIGGKEARYYQQVAINRAVEAVIKGQERILITMATGTGKTFVAFQLVWRLWKAGRKKRILYLADRNILVDQAKDRTFAPFGDAVTKLKGRAIKSREIYFALYQALYNAGGGPNLYEKYPRDFFDLIIVDECHRGSARDDSSWRQILEYFAPATQVGMTATPKRDDNIDTYNYFGSPIYTYSLAEGIDDGFLAPYRVHRIIPSSDAFGVAVDEGTRDRLGREIPAGLYQTKDFERVLSVLSRTDAVAKHLNDTLKSTDRMAKTIVFCVDQEHALEMRRALARLNPDLLRLYPDYVVRVVSDEKKVGRGHLDNFQDPEKETPVIVTSSQMLTTGVDAPTVRNIVIFRPINSMVDFKQIIGRGTRLSLENDKFYFTILDYTGATKLFYDPAFDGYPDVEVTVAIDEEGAETAVDGETVKSENEGTDRTPDDDGPDRVVHDSQKYYIDGGEVYMVGEQVFELDAEGNTLRTLSFTDFVRDQLRRLVPDAQHLLDSWPLEEQRRDIVAALAQRGITLDELAERTKRPDADALDLLLHVAYNAPLVTRRERAAKLRQDKPNFFNQYEPAARAILDELLEKYADYGYAQLEDLGHLLQVPPFSAHGNVSEIAALFGSAEQMKGAVDQLKQLIYQV
jgi:type I restriction enzyme R subunit